MRANLKLVFVKEVNRTSLKSPRPFSAAHNFSLLNLVRFEYANTISQDDCWFLLGLRETKTVGNSPKDVLILIVGADSFKETH
jgi:hypothetical protein